MSPLANVSPWPWRLDESPGYIAAGEGDETMTIACTDMTYKITPVALAANQAIIIAAPEMAHMLIRLANYSQSREIERSPMATDADVTAAMVAVIDEAVGKARRIMSAFSADIQHRTRKPWRLGTNGIIVVGAVEEPVPVAAFFGRDGETSQRTANAAVAVHAQGMTNVTAMLARLDHSSDRVDGGNPANLDSTTAIHDGIIVCARSITAKLIASLTSPNPIA